MSLARPKATRSGFTLVELLVVITIIGILAGLLTVGLFAAFGTSKDFMIAQELAQIQTGVESFNSKLGTYPPDMQSLPAFNAFVSKAYPRCNRTLATSFVTAAGGRIDPAEALVLYLAYTTSDSRDPFRFAREMAGNVNAWKQPATDLVNFATFPPDALRDMDNDGFPEFTQAYARRAPVLYFDARTYTAPAVAARTAQVGFSNSGYSGLTGDAAPYASGLTTTNTLIFHNPKSYQLISAGQNGEFGVNVSAGIDYPLIPGTPIPTTYMPALPRVIDSDGDNITNFTSGRKFDNYLVQ